MYESHWSESVTKESLIGVALLVALVVISDITVKFILRRLASNSILKKNYYLFPFLNDKKLVQWISTPIWPMVIYIGLYFIPHLPTTLESMTRRALIAFTIIFMPLTLSHIFRIINEKYSQKEISRSRPIKGYLQGILIVVYFLCIISAIAVLFDQSPLLFLSGLGAISAVLLLVFKDTILSLVAGAQLTTNDLIRVGDWIEMPQFNADGDVLEITLHSVKVQNWDKTITMIPAHKFLESAFTNWRGMTESGGRRIKRSINIDVNSIRFLSDEDIKRFSEFALLKDYLQEKMDEIKKSNGTEPRPFNTRRLTNIGTFRKYIAEYLRVRPDIHKDMTFLVRQLQPSAEGLPIEIYVFTNDTRWSIYEGIQADIFDHILAIIPEFGLQYYQRPSSGDIGSLFAMQPQMNQIN